MLNRYSGFTLVELITVILLLGILAVSVGPRIFGGSGVGESVLSAQLVSLLRNEQTYAMQDVINPCYGVSFAASKIVPNRCGKSLSGDQLTAFDGINISVSTVLAGGNQGFRFNGLGCPVTLNHENDKQTCAQSADVQVTLRGSQVQHVCVQSQGYIRKGLCS